MHFSVRGGARRYRWLTNEDQEEDPIRQKEHHTATEGVPMEAHSWRAGDPKEVHSWREEDRAEAHSPMEESHGEVHGGEGHQEDQAGVRNGLPVQGKPPYSQDYTVVSARSLVRRCWDARRATAWLSIRRRVSWAAKACNASDAVNGDPMCDRHTTHGEGKPIGGPLQHAQLQALLCWPSHSPILAWVGAPTWIVRHGWRFSSPWIFRI